jgi:hypothetical protein
VRPVPTMPLMVESLTIELMDLRDRGPAPQETAASEVLAQAALDFAWGRIERPWACRLAERMGEELPDLYSRVVVEADADADRLDLYAAAGRLLCELEEELALTAEAPRR